jgi:hypothetical protein
MADMTVHQPPFLVQLFVTAVVFFAVGLAWFRWRQGTTNWMTIAWWTAIAWAVSTVLFVAFSFLNR